MSIYVECRSPGCHARNALKNQKCRKCGARIPPTGRVYWLELRVDGKKRTERLGMVSLQTAKEIESKRITERAEGRYFPKSQAPVVPTWGEVARAFTRKLEVEGRTEGHQRNVWRALNEMSAFWGATLPITEITADMVREFQYSLKERGLSYKSCDLDLSAGRAAWKHSCGKFPSPFQDVKAFHHDNRVTRFLTDDERARLLEAALKVSRSLYEIICVALSTGLRKSNILNLRRSEVDFRSRMINVVQKGRRPFVIGINPDLYEILKKIPDNGTPFFWISSWTGKPYTKVWKRPWIKARTLAGIDSAFRFHDLRHDFATVVYGKTRDFRITQQLLGHSNIKNTDRYAHVLPDYQMTVIELVNPLKGQPLTSLEPPTNTPIISDKS
jgi:integrase